MAQASSSTMVRSSRVDRSDTVGCGTCGIESFVALDYPTDPLSCQRASVMLTLKRPRMENPLTATASRDCLTRQAIKASFRICMEHLDWRRNSPGSI